ncbi:MAG TPA: hypothetical protein ENH01_06885 [Nitrospirae bacterium]|nr:hypothetical protein [Nitrospirota bacterium]
MNVLGMGIICAQGRGVDRFRDALNRGWQKPAEIGASYLKDGKSFAYLADIRNIADRTLLKKMRRSDKLSKMAVYAASEAFKNSGIENIDGKTVGIITATAFGPHVTTFDFLDEILQYGELHPSPTSFSNSVHNAASSYISSALNIQGPTLTVTQFFFSFQSALQLARSWLNEGRCDYVLVGTAEQYGDVLGYIYNEKLRAASDGRIKPFDFNPVFHVPGEGAVFFLLSNRKTDNTFCEVENILMDAETENSPQVDLNIIDADGMLADESVYAYSLSEDIPAAAYSPLFGSMMTGSAFNCAAGALMLKEQIKYANPVRDNPHGLNIVSETKKDNIELIRIIRYNCYGNKAGVYLGKK